MTTAIKLKKSSVTGRAPTSGDLDHGELALNFADGRLYYKNSSNVIKNFVDSDILASVINSDVKTLDQVTTQGNTTSNSITVGGLTSAGILYPDSDGGIAGYALTTDGNDNLRFTNVQGLTGYDFPIGDWGSVDSSAQSTDAFGQQLVGLGYGYDCLTLPEYFEKPYDFGQLS